MGLPQLSSCCCGCTLRTGTLIILWLYLVFSILALAAPSLNIDIQTNGTKIETPSTIPAQSSATASPTDSSKMAAALGVWDVILAIISIVVSGVGLYGTYKELHLYLTPFLAWEMVYVLIQIALGLIAKFSVAVLVGDLIGFLIFFYFWLVVFSHFRVLKGSVRPIQA